MHASSEPSRPLAGQAAVVTGASSGIGRAIALTLAERGAHVLVHACSNRLGLEETASQAAAYGVQTACELQDLSEPEGCHALVEAAWQWRSVDIWVHIAGADVLTGAAAELDFAGKLDLLWRTDVRGAMLACREAGQRMRDRGAGVLLTIGWDQAEVGMAGDSGEMFAAVKGAVMAFTRSLAKSLAPEVRVNCLAPGWIKTRWGDSAPEHWQQRAVRESLVGRWGEPADVAEAAAFLASPAAAFVSGQIININGGFSGTVEP